jgi:hypothetical protein
VKSLRITITPFRWRLRPCHERCVIDSTVRWLCISVTWDNPPLYAWVALEDEDGG